MNTACPYNYNLPVSSDMFYGRQSDVDMLLNSVLATPGDSCALIGGRRLGKTSLLEALISHLETISLRSGFLVLPIFLDLSGAEIDSVTHFFTVASNQAVGLLQEKWNVKVEPLRLANDQPPAPAFENLLPLWDRDVIANQGYPLRLVLVLDECEHIVEQTWATSLYGSLRHLLVGRNTRMLIKIVMAGAHGFLSRVRQQGSPLRNILKYQTLKVFDIDSTFRLINEPTHNSISKDMVSLIAQQSGGHPFLTQYLMYKLWEIGLEQVTEAQISKVSRAFSQERHDFQDWLDSLGTSAYFIYSVLAKANSPMSEQEIQNSLEGHFLDFIQTLDALCYHGIVVKEEAGYRITGSMFYEWFMPYGLHWYENQQMEHRHPQSSSQILQQTIIQGSYLDQRGQNIEGTQNNVGKDAQLQHDELSVGNISDSTAIAIGKDAKTDIKGENLLKKSKDEEQQ
jgi:hypothetical protein